MSDYLVGIIVLFIIVASFSGRIRSKKCCRGCNGCDLGDYKNKSL